MARLSGHITSASPDSARTIRRMPASCRIIEGCGIGRAALDGGQTADPVTKAERVLGGSKPSVGVTLGVTHGTLAIQSKHS